MSNSGTFRCICSRYRLTYGSAYKTIYTQNVVDPIGACGNKSCFLLSKLLFIHSERSCIKHFARKHLLLISQQN